MSRFLSLIAKIFTTLCLRSEAEREGTLLLNYNATLKTVKASAANPTTLALQAVIRTGKGIGAAANVDLEPGHGTKVTVGEAKPAKVN